MDIIEALPFKLVSLDTQIKNAGGQGYNCDTVRKPVPNSFSYLYSFPTADGVKTIRSRNTVAIGTVDHAGLYFVVYDGDTSEFSLVQRKTTPNGPVLMIQPLGFDFSELENKLREYWPDVKHYDLKDPRDLMNLDSH